MKRRRLVRLITAIVSLYDLSSAEAYRAPALNLHNFAPAPAYQVVDENFTKVLNR